MKGKGWIWLGAILLAVFAAKTISTLFLPSDKKLIEQALVEAEKASREGRPGGVMEVLSDQFKLNGQESSSTLQISKWIQGSHPDVTISTVDPVVSGDDATVVSPVSIDASLPVVGHAHYDFKNVTLKFHRDDDHEWFVIPVKKWKLVGASIPPSEIPSDIGAFGSMGG